MRLSEAPAEWLGWLERGKRLAPATLASYRQALTQWEAFCRSQGVDVLSIARSDVQRWIVSLSERDLAASTIQHRRSVIHGLYRWLLLGDRIGFNPVDGVDTPALPVRERKHVTPADMSEMLAVLVPGDVRDQQAKALMRFLFATGCRSAELRALKLQDLRLADGYAWTIGKGDKQRRLIVDHIRDGFEHWLNWDRIRWLKGPSDYVFPAMTGAKMPRGGINPILQRVAARAEVDDITAHAFRRGFATTMYEAGVSIPEISHLMGHASISTTMRYISISVLKEIDLVAYAKALAS